ncbi:MAG TPA: 6-phosphogluconolactonase [Afifellaceae bacterium]|nr:6-phosphogluconolactonase [Afifellaceae bacterium]
MVITRRDFADRETLAVALVDTVAARLRAAIDERGEASIAVSGGSTPERFFDVLSRADLNWGKVGVTLVDERWVPPDHERSNGRLVAGKLLTNRAAAARFIPLYCDAARPDDGMASLLAALATLPMPFDVAVLGMGTDGHTASFFPGGDHLAEALDPGNPALLTAMSAPGAGEPRLTLTLPPILASGLIALHIEGEDKKIVLAQALADGPVENMPVRAVLRSGQPVTVFWAP